MCRASTLRVVRKVKELVTLLRCQRGGHISAWKTKTREKEDGSFVMRTSGYSDTGPAQDVVRKNLLTLE